MIIKPNDLKDLVRIGGSISIDASSLVIIELKEIIQIANPKATIIIRNAINIPISELKGIVKIAGCNIISEF